MTSKKNKHWNIQLQNTKGQKTNVWVHAPEDDLSLAMQLAENKCTKPDFKPVKSLN